MKVSIDWIQDFVDLKSLPVAELAERFTLGAAEIEEVQTVGDYWEKISVAQITGITPHPEADKLNLVTFDYGAEETKTVVCGASNVRIGLKTPFAPIGTTLPIGFTLEPKKIRGILSDGMLCSEQELGLCENSEGIMELPEEAPVGKTLREYWGKKTDVIIDIENKSLTHRPDMWGHFGMAREFAALTKRPLKNPYDHLWAEKLKKQIPGGESPIKVSVNQESAGLAYFALSLDNVTVGHSPSWMVERLEAAGFRSLNNIVDISNYVMLELGFPLHIFDRDKISGETLEIKRMGVEESFITLDEQERKLIPTDTVISDKKGPLVLAGIMGGLSSGVSEKTTKILIEVANWKAAEVRKTSTRLGLRTDSSQRYEKSLDSLQCEKTLLRTLELILSLCPQAKVVGKIEYDGKNLEDYTPLKIKTSADKISRVLGYEVTQKRVEDILKALDFKIEGELLVTVPSFRATKDIECEDDLIEEIGRVIGYGEITPASPLLPVFPVSLSAEKILMRRIQDFLVSHTQALEVLTYPLIGKKLLDKTHWPLPESENQLRLVNALSIEAEMMRPSLIPSTLELAQKNSKHFHHFKSFEIGRAYLPTSKKETFFEERTQLIISFYHREKGVFLNLVNQVERLLKAMNIPAQIQRPQERFTNLVCPHSWIGRHPHEAYDLRIMGKMNGVITSVHPLLLRELKIRGHLAFALIDLTEASQKELARKVNYSPLPKFPGSSFDWTITAPKEALVSEIFEALKKVKNKDLQNIKIVDIFTPAPAPNIQAESKFITLRAQFQNPEKTLGTEELGTARDQLIEILERAGFPLKRE